MVRFVLLTYVCIIGFVYFYQRKLQYLPSTDSPTPPEWATANGLEEFSVTTADDVTLHGWYWPGERPVTFVIFHGNGGHRGHRLFWMNMLRQNLRAHVCVIDYRGYGGSEGSPTEAGFYHDAEATLKWLQERAAPPAIYVGESLGTGVAVELAARQRPRGLILHSSFSSAVDVGAHVYPYLPVRWMMKDRYDNASKIKKIECPLLVIHGEDDRIVPIAFGRKLYEAAQDPKEWYPVAGAGHNNLVGVQRDEYLKRLEAFVQSCLE